MDPRRFGNLGVESWQIPECLRQRHSSMTSLEERPAPHYVKGSSVHHSHPQRSFPMRSWRRDAIAVSRRPVWRYIGCTRSLRAEIKCSSHTRNKPQTRHPTSFNWRAGVDIVTATPGRDLESTSGGHCKGSGADRSAQIILREKLERKKPVASHKFLSVLPGPMRPPHGLH